MSGAVRFYVERLGFELAFQDSDDDPRYAGVRRGAVELHLQFQFEKEFKAGTAGRAMLRLVGLFTFACLQDLSQTRARWTGVAADGLFSLFGTKVLLPGLGWSLGLAHMLVR